MLGGSDGVRLVSIVMCWGYIKVYGNSLEIQLGLCKYQFFSVKDLQGQYFTR